LSSSLFKIATSDSLNDNRWIIVTSAINHMICSISYFTSITSIVSKCVKLPNGQFASVTHIGTIRVFETIILTEVLCVPSFSINLISASKLIRNLHCCVIFLVGFTTKNFDFFQCLSNWKTIEVGRKQRVLFHLLHKLKSSNDSHFSAKVSGAPTFTVNVAISANIWHFLL
jgi:hypothetical protein